MFETVIVKGALVVPVRWFPKVAGLGEKLRIGTAGEIPAPVKETLLGLDGALVVKVRFAVLPVAVVGEKTTLIEQDADAANVPPQVLPFVENSVAFVPVNVMLLIVNEVLPVFVSVTARLPLEVPVV